MKKSFDPANYDWWCDECNASLNDQPGFDPNCGSWVCTECGQLNYIDENKVIDDSASYSFEDASDDDDIPEGCAACGGPYPDCTSSCPMFDD